ncbi:AcrR family transcriptional regulator [Kineococcus radiotolerans]|uniref:AcrR family transcriptional regulator n=1 Tax=Kineococcus radiotolerans TaxID=131568 RepID=A0A7W4TLQ9_KINRA|nr:TetR/AcrR family transcriptional regulator [Kineococcus radiotolerans]MBB2901244.1 AcrR family transcriptional regulator [Kineococcus radiotolerans]
MTETARRGDTRSRIVEAAARLLGEHGPAAVTTRGVAEAAGVQAPAIYRLFGDKDGLLDAVAEHVLDTHVAAKAVVVAAAAADDVDPLEDLRSGWRAQIEFGLANPALFRLLSDPGRVLSSPAAAAGLRVLQARVHRLATAGRLRVGERRAVQLVQAAGVGTTTTLLSLPPRERDPALADAMLEAVLAQVLVDAPRPAGDGTTAAAVAFRALAPDLPALTDGERRLLGEWLDRVVAAG